MLTGSLILFQRRSLSMFITMPTHIHTAYKHSFDVTNRGYSNKQHALTTQQQHSP